MAETESAQGTNQGEFFAEPYEPMEIGPYEAELSRIFTPEKDGPYGPQRQWYFKILDPDYEGKELMRYTSQSFAPSSTPRQFVEALLGRAVEEGEKISFADLKGSRCIVHVTHKQSERGVFEKIDSISPVRKKKKQKQQPVPEPEPEEVEVEDDEEEETPPF